MSIGRQPLPMAWKPIVPAAKHTGKELTVQASPELIDIATRKINSKTSLENTVKNTIEKQVEAGWSKTHMIRKRRRAKRTKRETKTLIQKKRTPFFSPKYEKLSNLIPNEATHSSLDIFKKTHLIVAFENAFTQKTGSSYSPDVPILENEVPRARNKFIDLQRTRLEFLAGIVQSNGDVL